MTPQETLRHHVTGAIERGEAEPIVEMTMESVLQRSIDMHPTLLVDTLRRSLEEDSRYRRGRRLAHTVDRAVLTRMGHLEAAISAIEGTAGGDAKAVALMGMGPLILAFNEACRCQCIPHHQRTEIACNSQ